jgi:hypothetical protein
MTSPPAARLYLYPDLLRRVRDGRHPLLCPLVTVLDQAGFAVSLHGDSPEDLAAGRRAGGWSLVRMIAPLGPGGVTFRKTCLEPFYHIETRAERWLWPVASAAFDPDQPTAKAARFMSNMRGRLFGPSFDPARVSREGYVLVPLQGRLLQRRRFQTMAPIAMIDAVLTHDPERKVVATLHPRESYGPEDLAALDRLAERHPRFQVARTPSSRLLAGCDYVATMTSSVALKGYFLEKPAVLFGKTEFHHIASTVAALGPAEAIRRAPDLRPDFAAYLWWFFRVMAIRAQGRDADPGIRAALRRAGWPLDP